MVVLPKVRRVVAMQALVIKPGPLRIVVNHIAGARTRHIVAGKAEIDINVVQHVILLGPHAITVRLAVVHHINGLVLVI